MGINPNNLALSPQTAYPASATQAATTQPASISGGQRIEPVVYDSFQQSLLTPQSKASLKDKIKLVLFKPFSTLALFRKLKPMPVAGEKRMDRIKMYTALHKSLNAEGRDHLASLLKEGVLNDTDTDDAHSTLYHLYSILTTKRGRGLDQDKLLFEAVRILNKPYLITQKFAPLSENVAQEMLALRNNANKSNLHPVKYSPTGARPLTWNDINVDNSATCVSSSVMYYMADKKPGELARHLNELTSPMQAFYERVRLDELSPEDPSQATDILKAQDIQYKMSGPGEVMVKVELPDAGLLRTRNSNNSSVQTNVRTGVEAAYQSSLTYLSTRSYDPATDLRDSGTPGEGSKGLTELEKTLMETIVKDNGGVASVTYQVVAGKKEPQPGEEGLPFLYGYTRTFEQTATDIIDALKMGEFVIIGITDTAADGSIAGGHEITITSAFVDPKDGGLKFVVADSDDDIPTPVIREAGELIPKIHHAGMPLSLARTIIDETEKIPGYFIPEEADLDTFMPIDLINEPLPKDAFGDPNAVEESAVVETAPQAMTEQATTQPQQMSVTDNTPWYPAQPQQQQQPSMQTIEWVPVPMYSPYNPYMLYNPAVQQPQQAMYYPQQQAAYPQHQPSQPNTVQQTYPQQVYPQQGLMPSQQNVFNTATPFNQPVNQPVNQQAS